MDWQTTRDRLAQLARPHPGWWVLLAAVGLTVIGIDAIGTVDQTPGRRFFTSQRLYWLPLALVGMVLCLAPRPRSLGLASYALAGAALLLLVVLVAPGMPREIVPVINGARRWIDLQFMLVQPSELAKVAFVLALAWYLRYRESYRTLKGLLVPFAIMFVPVGLILLEPDLGTALLFAPTLFAMLVAAGARLHHLGVLLGLGATVAVLNVAVILWAPDSMQLLRPHQRERVVAMISQVQGETRYIQDIGYQQHKAIMLVGAGGLEGYGQESATILHFNRLPEARTDMIFAVIANRWGLVGMGTVIGLYLVIVCACLAVSLRSRDPFAKLACVGFGALIFTQASIHIGMTVGLLPVTGLTLPFVSYGGSSLVATFAMVGLVMNFASRRPMPMARPSFEFDVGAQAQGST